jgi:hypothetical protein
VSGRVAWIVRLVMGVVSCCFRVMVLLLPIALVVAAPGHYIDLPDLEIRPLHDHSLPPKKRLRAASATVYSVSLFCLAIVALLLIPFIANQEVDLKQKEHAQDRVWNGLVTGGSSVQSYRKIIGKRPLLDRLKRW